MEFLITTILFSLTSFSVAANNENTDQYYEAKVGFKKYNTLVLKVQGVTFLSKTGLFLTSKNKHKLLYKHVLIKVKNVRDLPDLSCDNFEEKVFVFAKHIDYRKNEFQPEFFYTLNGIEFHFLRKKSFWSYNNFLRYSLAWHFRLSVSLQSGLKKYLDEFVFSTDYRLFNLPHKQKTVFCTSTKLLVSVSLVGNTGAFRVEYQVLELNLANKEDNSLQKVSTSFAEKVVKTDFLAKGSIIHTENKRLRLGCSVVLKLFFTGTNVEPMIYINDKQVFGKLPKDCQLFGNVPYKADFEEFLLTFVLVPVQPQKKAALFVFNELGLPVLVDTVALFWNIAETKLYSVGSLDLLVFISSLPTDKTTHVVTRVGFKRNDRRGDYVFPNPLQDRGLLQPCLTYFPFENVLDNSESDE